MATMRVVQVTRPNGPFEIVERQMPQPGTGSVRIKVQACGICHSDSLVKEGVFPGIVYPRVPGHEVAGVIDAVGPGVAGWAPGQRAGVGWHGGYCGICDYCRRGNFFACVTGQVTGLTFDGGYAEYMIAPASAVARMPADLPPIDAAPLMCAEGWYSGTSIDSEDTLAFSARSGVRSMNEIYPLERAVEGYDRMMSGKARFRVVLTIGS